MRTLVKLDATRKALETRLDSELAALAEAIASGGDIDAAADRAEATEAEIRALSAKEYQQAKYLERRAAKAVADEQAIDALVAGGMNAEDARAHVTGVDVQKQRKRDFLAMVRDNGIDAVGFDDAVRKWHVHLVVEIVESLETWPDNVDHFRGALPVNARAERLGISPFELFFMSHGKVREYASEEMLTWFDNHGRLTRDDVRARALGQRTAPDNYYRQ